LNHLQNLETAEPNTCESTKKTSSFAGVPYIHPAVSLEFGELADTLNFWDRIVLLMGGSIVGFCFGVSATMLALANHEDPMNTGIAICALLMLLSGIMNAFFITRTQGLVKQVSEMTKHLAVTPTTSGVTPAS
jgi:hypothetical protein